MKKVAVIGAGPAGLTAAYNLQLGGIDVTVFEASDQVGGMARSFHLWGQIVDLGPHRFFSNDPRVNKFWLEILDYQYVMVKRLTRIYYKKVFFSYPIEVLNALKGLGIVEALRCILSLLFVRIFPNRQENKFDAWVKNRFGNRLFNIFFKSYTEKLWGIKCEDLDSDFAAQRIKKLSLIETIKSAFLKGNKLKHRTLADEFAYPILGAGQVYNKMLDKFVDAGGKLHLNSKVTNMSVNAESVKVILNDDESMYFDHVISTMPLTKLISMVGAPDNIIEKSLQLKFRNTILVYLRIAGENPFPDQWIYVHSNELRTGRITNFRNWTPTINNLESDHIICLEYWCFNDDEIWLKKDSDLIEMATKELIKTNLIPRNTITSGHIVRVPKCYPVYYSGYKEILVPIQEYLRTVERITPIGRYGSFKYNNQDHSILMGILAARNLLFEQKIDLWAINSDYEYQESTRITATGLVNEP